MANLLPPSSTPLERALATANAYDVDTDVIRAYVDPARCPAHLLGVLAWDWHVDEYDAAKTDAQRRALIAASWELHQYKGTAWAVLEALRAIGYPAVRLTEWFDAAPRRQPGTFELVFPPLPELQNPASWQRIHQVVRGYKNTRSWYTVAVALQPPGDGDNPVDPPIPLTCAAGAAAVMIGHVPVGPIALHAAIGPTLRAAVGPIIARPSGPATLPTAAGHAGQRGAAVVVVHVDSKPAEHWQSWAPHSLPRFDALATLQIVAGPVLASVDDCGAVLPAAIGVAPWQMAGVMMVYPPWVMPDTRPPGIVLLADDDGALLTDDGSELEL